MTPTDTLASEVEEVGEVRFSMMTAEDIRAVSACEITSTELYNGVSPVPGGLYDPRMGAYEYGSRCHTCMHGNNTCIGHPGHIELAVPVFNIETNSHVKKFLKCICVRCAALMVRGDDPDMAKLARRKMPNKKRFDAVLAACTRAGVKTCPSCQARRPDSVSWDKKTASAFLLTWKAEGDSPMQQVSMDAGMIEALFRKVSAADAATTGIHRPDALLLSVLPVPPIAVRPPAKNSSGQRRDDDLTINLGNIVKNNNLLKQRNAAGAPPETLTAMTQLLQYACITYINNSTTGGVPIAKVKATNRALRSVTSRLKGKDGRIRGNLSGKRVDQSARSVITPDPNISVEELGMPLRIAKTLSMPEVVRSDNMERLQLAVENGPAEYPGAIYVRIASSGSLVQLKRVEARRRVKLEEGDVVHRHLLNGDVVLFNRQPSLHRMSMMAHRVRVMPYDTFRLSVMVTPPYNADFDGDEMNAHCPQSATTATELRMLSGVASQIITPREHCPIIGVVQDVCLGLHLITHPDVRVNRKAACNLLAHLSTCGGEVGPDVWTGSQLLSALLPPTLHLEGIEYGVVKGGQLNKDSYQGSTDGILHAVYNDNGPRRAVRLLDDTQNLACDWLMMNGFSVGIADLIGGPELLEKIDEAIKTSRAEVSSILRSIHTGEFTNETFDSDSDLVEKMAIKTLKAMFDGVGKNALTYSREHGSRLLSMVDAKSKGKQMNVCQMMGALGQQEIGDCRVPLSFEGRVLPHFARYDDGCEARGMVESSFVKGLTPAEFFMHAISGREGLIDTAVKSVTGDTPVIYMEDGVAKYAMIGDWIDGELALRPGDVAHFEERRMELLDIENDVFIPTTDYDGNVTWGRVTAMARHDPGTELYEIKTSGGKSVIVTESKSLLIWHPDLGQFKEVLTPEITVGDFVPVTAYLPGPPVSGSGTVEEGRTAGALAAGGEDFIATETFVQSDGFVKGFLAAYFEARGEVFGDTTTAFCGSKRVAEGVAMLCSRIGVFCEVQNRCTIFVKGKWSAKLAEAFGWAAEAGETGFEEHNDVVLDRIVEINVLGVDKYPKVYDLTIPSTLNFGLANGLQVRDTSETGYLQRKLIKALEDCKVAYDRSVRTPNGSVVQFMYGEDGMDACSIETQKLPIMQGDLPSMVDRFLWTKGDLAGMQALLNGDVLERLSTDDAVFERLEAHFKQLVRDKDALAKLGWQDAVFQPIAFERILRSAGKTHSSGVLLDLHPAAALDVIDELVAKMQVGNHKESTPLLAALVRSFLSPKTLLREYRFNATALAAAKAAIERAFMSALCSPSEMVGVLAAQSIAEPLTQMVLNTFHSAGVGSATKQLGGVPRIKELLSYTKNPRTPVMTVYLRHPKRDNALALCDRLVSRTVNDLMKSTAIMYDAEGDAQDDRMTKLHEAFDIDTADPAIMPWLLRIEFDRRKMVEADVHMYDVHRALTEAFAVCSVHSDDGARDLVMRLRPSATAPDMMSEMVAFEDHVLASRVSGVPDVRMAHDFPDESSSYDPVRRDWFKREGEYMVTTQGANFLEVLSMDGVDTVRTTTNVIQQVLDVLGIEAARTALLSELSGNYAWGGSYVNHRHLALLVEFMVHSGKIMAVDRHGINHGDIGPLAKCSFEQPVDNLVSAAVFRESDRVEGVAASIMLGQVSRCGTGDGDVVLDAGAYLDIDGDKAPPADLRNERDPANEPALDSLMALSFTRAKAPSVLAIDPAAFVAAA